MSCYTAGLGSVSFCITTDEREELPIINDPLLPTTKIPEFDLLGRSTNVDKALGQIGQSQMTLDIFKFIDRHATMIGFLLPLTVPLVHYGMKLASLLFRNLLFFTDIHRILLNPFWRAIFRLPSSLSLHPSYTLYVYCCDLLCISSPEPDEFFHPNNYAQFTRLLWLINPLKFTIINQELLLGDHKESPGDYQEKEAGVPFTQFDYADWQQK